MASKTAAPVELISDLDFVADEVRRLHTQWDCFEQLFLAPGRSELRAHASHLLGALHVALATDIVMTICRLCDPAVTAGKPNLVLRRFLEEHPHLKPRLGQQVQRLKRLYEQHIQPVRHKRLAHNGLLVLRGQERISAPKVKALRLAVQLCDSIAGTLYAELAHVAISFTPSCVPGEVDWIEASLRLLDEDRIRIAPHLDAVRGERLQQRG